MRGQVRLSHGRGYLNVDTADLRRVDIHWVGQESGFKLGVAVLEKSRQVGKANGAIQRLGEDPVAAGGQPDDAVIAILVAGGRGRGQSCSRVGGNHVGGFHCNVACGGNAAGDCPTGRTVGSCQPGNVIAVQAPDGSFAAFAGRRHDGCADACVVQAQPVPGLV